MKISVAEFAARYPMTPRVFARVAQLQPDGQEEGCLWRGVHRKPLSWRRAKRLYAMGRLKYQPFRKRGGGGVFYGWENSPGALDRLFGHRTI